MPIWVAYGQNLDFFSYIELGIVSKGLSTMDVGVGSKAGVVLLFPVE